MSDGLLQQTEPTLLGEVVIVDDDEELVNTLEEFLKLRHCAVRKAMDADRCLELFKSYPPDMAIIDLGLEDPEKDGIWLLQKLNELAPDVPVVVLSGFARIEAGVRAMRVGASDFIEKPIMPQYLFEVVRRSIMVGRERKSRVRLKQALLMPATHFVGTSILANNIREQLTNHANKNSHIMLTGPAGAGKQHTAKYLHSISSRQSEPFIVVHCVGKSVEILEKELFGDTLGNGNYIPGKIEQANGGTLYLNEFTAIPPELQKKLVRAIVRRRFQRVGGSSVAPLDFRIVSSSSKNLATAIEDGSLRKDLYDRLSVEKIHIPPLDARKVDIPELCQYFVNEFCQSSYLPRRKFSEDAVNYLQTISIPGNIRQLRNLVQFMLIKPVAEEIIQVDEIKDQNNDSSVSSDITDIDLIWGKSLREARSEFERQYLMNQINRFDGNVSIAAEHIGMERSALHRKLKDLGVETKSRYGSRVAGLKESTK